LPFLVWVQRILKAVRLKDDLHVAQAVFRRWARFPGLCSSLREAKRITAVSLEQRTAASRAVVPTQRTVGEPLGCTRDAGNFLLFIFPLRERVFRRRGWHEGRAPRSHNHRTTGRISTPACLAACKLEPHRAITARTSIDAGNWQSPSFLTRHVAVLAPLCQGLTLADA
jgi:hypothetical protein